MLAHYLMGRHTRDLPYFLESQKLVSTSHGRFSISPSIGAHFLLSFLLIFRFFVGVMTSLMEIVGEVARLSSSVGVDEPLSVNSFYLFFSLSVILSLL